MATEGTVRVHAFRVAAELFLAPMLAGFARDFPDIVLDITLNDTVVDLVTGGSTSQSMSVR